MRSGKEKSSKASPLPSPVPYTPPKFHADDPQAAEFLAENGYVVYSQVASEQQTKEAIALFWDYMESLGIGIDRTDEKTWYTSEWPAFTKSGVIAGHGAGQSAFLWYCRGLPDIKKAFQTVWSHEDLLVSFDGCGSFRPEEQAVPGAGSWYHFDQNGHSKRTKCCVQGFLNLFPSQEEDGGLVLFPRSHHFFNQLFTEFPSLCSPKGSDFVPLYGKSKALQEVWQAISGKWKLSPIKVCVGPGDFVMWDSRVIHCNTPSKTSAGAAASDGVRPLRRLVAYICMTPTTFVKDKSVVEKKLQAYKQGVTTNHWPHEFKDHVDGYQVPEGFRVPPLTPFQQQLVTGGLIPFD